ncbi:hypothetical protein N9A94_02625 [Akkermansiaceae bacterium]|nr:hypothetical protein [Akkermansiaceae bacterium]MDB4537109.1 hypothetical protein [Akkermansiaceae bacterium]
MTRAGRRWRDRRVRGALPGDVVAELEGGHLEDGVVVEDEIVVGEASSKGVARLSVTDLDDIAVRGVEVSIGERDVVAPDFGVEEWVNARVAFQIGRYVWPDGRPVGARGVGGGGGDNLDRKRWDTAGEPRLTPSRSVPSRLRWSSMG